MFDGKVQNAPDMSQTVPRELCGRTYLISVVCLSQSLVEGLMNMTNPCLTCIFKTGPALGQLIQF